MAGPYLATSLRKQLAKTIGQARTIAEAGAAEAIRRLAVGEARAPEHLRDVADRKLRTALRAHGRALGDQREASGAQATAKLRESVAYEHWHRMLFARFLAERELLIHPEHKVHVTLADCKELAAEEGLPDAWAVAERYATRMLPGIFRPNDPALALPLAPEHQQALQALVVGLDSAVFEAADSLGWTYQFWRAAEKDAVNERVKSGAKIGADELPAVTQLFTEPYMVQFLLHNTLGAWWAGKRLAVEPELARTAADETALRAAVSLPGIDWTYLRFVREDNYWRPAAGTFPGWPQRAVEITVMDPCCGSGHFLVEALGILAALRAVEEGLAPAEAIRAVLRDNLFGLEIDGRCVQIAAFAVALAAWSIAGEAIDLPRPHVAWVGQAPAVGKSEWLRLAEAVAATSPLPPKRDLLGTEDNLFSFPDRWALELLWGLFGQAPILGSLLDLGAVPPLFAEHLAGFEAALARAAFGESETDELALAARGMADAAGVLARRYTVLATNVPFLAAGKMTFELREHIEANWTAGKADLATAMLLRMLTLASAGGTVALVTPQNWYFLGSYRKLRELLLSQATLDAICDLGPAAFNDMNWWAARTALTIVTKSGPHADSKLIGIDAEAGRSPEVKEQSVREAEPRVLEQAGQRGNPDCRITLTSLVHRRLLSEVADYGKGSTTGDRPRFLLCFWELPRLRDKVSRWLDSPKPGQVWSGRELVLSHSLDSSELTSQLGCRLHGQEVWGRRGVALTKMRQLDAFLYDGEVFDDNVGIIAPKDPDFTLAITAFVMAPEYQQEIRKVDKVLKVTAATLVKVPFHLAHWQEVAATRYPSGLSEPYSDDPTQWLFHGHPAQAEKGMALHVALARLAGFRWPAETDEAMRLSAEAREWIAEAATLPPAVADGILCLPPVGGEAPLAERLRDFLAVTFGSTWNTTTERRLLAEAAERTKEKAPSDLAEWLRNRFFRQHCTLFHHRPFLWHIWDGQKDGFAAVLHYHHLTRTNLEKLTYTVLGDWLARMKDLGDARRLEAARILQQKLELILTGEAPYDIFVRWKPLAGQPLGWDPDLDDGVRLNIRPFVTAGILRETPNIHWRKDRGTDVATAPWYHLGPHYGGKPGDRINDHYTTLVEKQAAREKMKTG